MSLIDTLFVKPIDFFLKNAKFFNSFRKWIHDDFKIEKKLIKKEFSDNKKTLDFGCGVGQYSILFNSKNYFGADIDKSCIDFTKKERKGNFIHIKDSKKLNFKNNYFDQILVTHVTHHINDNIIKQTFKEFNRILKKNGKIMIIDHYPIKYQPNLICKFMIKVDRGKNFRNVEQLQKLFFPYFKILKKSLIKSSVYRDYALIINKK